MPRAAVYVLTKVGRYAPDPRAMFDFSGDRVIASVHESLDRLGIEYIDVIQGERSPRQPQMRQTFELFIL